MKTKPYFSLLFFLIFIAGCECKKFSIFHSLVTLYCWPRQEYHHCEAPPGHHRSQGRGVLAAVLHPGHHGHSSQQSRPHHVFPGEKNSLQRGQCYDMVMLCLKAAMHKHLNNLQRRMENCYRLGYTFSAQLRNYKMFTGSTFLETLMDVTSGSIVSWNWIQDVYEDKIRPVFLSQSCQQYFWLVQ